MRLLLVNLLALTMLAMPMHAYAMPGWCGCVESEAQATLETQTAGVKAQKSCCCSSTTPIEDEPAPTPRPCDDGDCPASCCTGVVQGAFVLPAVPAIPQLMPVHRAEIPREASGCASPHLLRLKRPPRTV